MQEGIYVVLVCGSRTITNKSDVYIALQDCIYNYVFANKYMIIEGGAKGVDTLARKFAQEYGIDYLEYPADWKQYGKRAGYIRNKQMVNLADYVIAIWDGESKGTASTIMLGHRKGIPVEVRIVRP